MLSTQNNLLEDFVTLCNDINYLHPYNEYRTILYFYRNLSCIWNKRAISINEIGINKIVVSNKFPFGKEQ